MNGKNGKAREGVQIAYSFRINIVDFTARVNDRKDFVWRDVFS